MMVGDLVWNLMMLAMVFPRLAILDWQGGSLMETKGWKQELLAPLGTNAYRSSFSANCLWKTNT